MLMRLSDIDRMFNAMDLLQSRMDRMSSDYGGSRTFLSGRNKPHTSPGTNLYDAGGKLEMKMEVPGIAKEDLTLKIQGNYLEVSGNRKSDTPEGYSSHRVERGTTSFTRSFTLPSDVDSSKVEAQLANGLLTIVLPKSEAARPKQIAIN
jgi:HSP20 family protein